MTIDQPRPTAALGNEPIRTIGRDEPKAKLDRGDDFTLIMALNRWAFDAKHIPGSRHFDTPDELYTAVDPGDEVVVYCSHVDCLSSVALYRDLVRRGYRNVRRYAGGLLDWEEAGLPLEGGFVTRAARHDAKPSGGDASRRAPLCCRGRCRAARLVRIRRPGASIDARGVPVPGYYRDPDWSVRDVVAHVGTWLAEGAAQFERISAGTYEGHGLDIDALNADFLEAMSGQPGRSHGSRRHPGGPG